MKGQLRINQLFAFVVLDADGTEAVPGYVDSAGWKMAMMGADMMRVDSLKDLAATDPRFRGKKITILRFGDRETIGTIDRTHEREPSVTCPFCKRVSYHPADVANRFCGGCHRFHDGRRVP